MAVSIRKDGIPVLAYSKCDDLSPVSSFLVFRYNEARRTATLLLQSSLFLDGFDDAKTFVLQYDADNLKPGANSVGPATIPLPQTRLEMVSRTGNPQIRTLSLTLMRACPLWCPSLSEPIRPRPGNETEAAFDKLAGLAKSTELSILFDYNWLHSDQHVIFHQLVDCPDQLSAFPVWRYYNRRYRRLDWSVLSTEHSSTCTPALVDVDITTEDEYSSLPPAYSEGIKRPRYVSKSPTPSSPARKRALLSPFPDCISTSPTEKGSMVTPSSKFSDTSTSPRFLPLAASISKPRYTPGVKASSVPPPASTRLPAALEPSLQHAVQQAVCNLVPKMLDTLLPTVLPRLLAASSPVSPSQQSIASQTSHPPPPPKLSALGISLYERLASSVEAEIEGIYAHTLSHANWLRTTADDEFAQLLEEERLALDRDANSKFEDFKEHCGNIIEDMEEMAQQKADNILARTEERLEKLKQEKASLEREREELNRSKEEHSRNKEELNRDREDMRRDKEDLRKEKDDLRKEKDDLRRDRESIQRKIERLSERREHRET